MSPAGLKVELRFPVCLLAQSQIRFERFALFGDETLEQGGLSFRTKRLDLFRGEGLLRNGLVDTEVATLAVATATVKVLSLGLLDGALLAFRAHERSGRRSRACLCRRWAIRCQSRRQGRLWRDVQLRQFLLELVVDARNHVEILGFAFGNIVELLLKGARVVVLKKGEVAFKRVDRKHAEVRGPQYLLGIVDVVAGDDVLED